MAPSKALEAEEWRESIKTSLETRRRISGDLPRRMRNRTKVGSREASRYRPESVYGDVREKIDTTVHAEYRKAQRNLSDQDINYVLIYGQIFHKAGAAIAHLREKDIPYADRADHQYQRLIGTTVVMTSKGHRRVLTAYRNRQSGLHHIKRKLDYGRPLH